MIRIKIAFLSLLADIFSEEETTFSIKRDSTIEDALNILSKEYGNKF